MSREDSVPRGATRAAPGASVIVVTHNSDSWIRRCLSSLQRQSALPWPCEIIVVDNGSQDQTVEVIRREFPVVRILESPNRGFGAGCNRGAKAAVGEYLAFLNPDAEADPRWLAELVRPLETPKTIATSQIRLLEDPESLNTEGQYLHFTGLGFTNGYARPASADGTMREVPGFSGAAFALRREEFQALGGFDENFFLYMDDTELSWRARRAGYRIVCVPDSVAYHHYRPSLSPEKLYHLEKGRWILLRKHYRWWESIVYAPSLALTELFVWGYSLRFGWKGLSAKARAMAHAIRIRPERFIGRGRLSGFASWRLPSEPVAAGRINPGVRSTANAVFRVNTIGWKTRGGEGA